MICQILEVNEAGFGGKSRQRITQMTVLQEGSRRKLHLSLQHHVARLPPECNPDPDIGQKNSPAQTPSGLHHRLSDQPEAAKNIARVDDQKGVISDRLIVDRVVVGCNDDSIEIL